MDPPVYSLRPVTDDDYDFLFQLHVATMRPSVEATWGWNEAFQELYFQSRWDPANQHIVSIGKIDVGTITVEEEIGTVFLNLIEIRPEYQGRGLGTALIRDVLRDAHNRDLPVKLHVLKTNLRARQLYERLGFTILEERKERHVMINSPATKLA